MIIDIRDSITHIHKISNYNSMNEFFESGEKLGIFKKLKHDYVLTSWIQDQILIYDRSVYIKKYWASYFCELEGIEKKEFINFQELAFELKEKNDTVDFLNISVNGKKFRPNWETTDKRDGRDTKSMIKFYKRTHPTTKNGCRYFDIMTKDQHTKLCCVCGGKDIHLLKGVTI